MQRDYQDATEVHKKMTCASVTRMISRATMTSVSTVASINCDDHRKEQYAHQRQPGSISLIFGFTGNDSCVLACSRYDHSPPFRNCS